MRGRLAALLIALAAPAAAQSPASGPAAADARRTILFVGNSFTYGAYSPVRRYRAETVTDLAGDGIGGVPALFKRFAEQLGQHWEVSLETSGGKGLEWHLAERRRLIDRRWDVVVLQGHSVLDRRDPGNPAVHVAAARALAALVTARNPQVHVELVATWPRPDLVLRPGSRWSGKPLAAMTADLQRAAEAARAVSPDIDGIAPVGRAFDAAVAAGVADPNPYDGLAYGQIDLWTYDAYHGSAYGYYLAALVTLARVTGLDPRQLGAKERAADDLGLDPKIVGRLQEIAAVAAGLPGTAR